MNLLLIFWTLVFLMALFAVLTIIALIFEGIAVYKYNKEQRIGENIRSRRIKNVEIFVDDNRMLGSEPNAFSVPYELMGTP